MNKVIPLDPIKRKVSKDICPKCGGELDTGWECNDCGFDAYAILGSHSQFPATPNEGNDHDL